MRAIRLLLGLAGIALLGAVSVFLWPGVETKQEGMDRLALSIQLIALSGGAVLLAGVLWIIWVVRAKQEDSDT